MHHLRPGLAAQLKLLHIFHRSYAPYVVKHIFLLQGCRPAWHCSYLRVSCPSPGSSPVTFPCGQWLAHDKGDGQTARLLFPGALPLPLVAYRPKQPPPAAPLTTDLTSRVTFPHLLTKSIRALLILPIIVVNRSQPPCVYKLLIFLMHAEADCASPPDAAGHFQ